MGPVAVRFKAPKGELDSCAEAALLLSFSRSSGLAPNVPSFNSVRRLSKEDGGEATLVSSRENRLLPRGEFKAP